MKDDLDSAHGDRVEHPPKDAPQLVTAQDIAAFRVSAQGYNARANPTAPMLDWFTEYYRAKAELARGEWQLP
jgi:hypothetical protein